MTRTTAASPLRALLALAGAFALAGCAGPTSGSTTPPTTMAASPSSTPTPTATPTPTPSATPTPGGCLRPDGTFLGVLTAGDCATVNFNPRQTGAAGQLTYSVDDQNWADALDSNAQEFFSSPAGFNTGFANPVLLSGVYVWADPAVAVQDYPSCPAKAQPGVATDIATTTAAIRALPGLVVRTQADTMIGGHPATVTYLELDAGAATSCADGAPFVSVIAGRDGFVSSGGDPDPYSAGLTGTQVWLIYLIDIGGGDTVAAVIADYDSGHQYEDLYPVGDALIQTFAFPE